MKLISVEVSSDPEQHCGRAQLDHNFPHADEHTRPLPKQEEGQRKRVSGARGSLKPITVEVHNWPVTEFKFWTKLSLIEFKKNMIEIWTFFSGINHYS